MAILSGTQTRYDIKGDREDLADVIYRISPEDTPFMSMIGKAPAAKSTLFEWQTDSLAAAATNAVVEGDEATFAVPSPTVRVGNYTQISRKTVLISGTMGALDLAGRKSEEALQTAKRSAELKLDMEKMLLDSVAGAAGSTSVARRTAGLPTWLKTNTDFGATGADSTYTSGVPTPARTDGTQRAFTRTILDTVIQAVWTSGGKPRVLMVGPFNKTVVSGFTGMASYVSNVDKPAAGFLVDAIDVYVNDFGKVRVIPNRLQRERDAFVLDPEMCGVSYLRPFKVEELAKTGDTLAKKQIIVEYGLKVNNEAGLGGCFDLLTS